MSNSHEPHALPYLEKTDIELLHEIITRAEELPEKTSRGLFDTYDVVLSEHRLDRDRDQKYFPFLLRMRRSPQARAKTFLEQFTDELSKLGISVVFDEDAASSASHAGDAPNEDENRRPLATTAYATDRAERRASFNEFESHGQLTSAASKFAVVGSLPRSISQDAIDHKARRALRELAAEPSANGQALAPQTRAYDNRTSFSGGTARKPVVQIRDDPSIYEFDRSVASDEVSETEDDDSRDQLSRPAKVGEEGQRSDVEIEAGKFRFRKLAARAHHAFHHWLRRTRALEAGRRYRVRQAEQQDGRALRKQALEQWRDKFLARKHEEEVELFYGALEKRAERARDLFLITKSFTHWAQCASEEILRITAARRHILRTRFFNAWRDITAVNELKVRRQGISKFFKTWKNRQRKLSSLERQALGFRYDHLSQTSYRDWFWEFCDRRAPQWHDSRVQERCWDHWSRVAQGYSIRSQWSSDFARLQLLRKIWNLWLQKKSVMLKAHIHARDSRRRSLAIRSLETLRRQLLFEDPVGRVTRARNWTTARSIFETWLAQTRLSLASKKAYDLRVTRNAWTKWNDELRCQALSRVVEERLLVQSLYRWLLAEREALLQRVRRENTKKEIFLGWLSQTRRTCSDVGRAEHRVVTSRTVRLKSAALSRWHARSDAHARDEEKALYFSRQKLLTSISSSWVNRKRRVQELEQWSKRAVLFIIVAPAMRKWSQEYEVKKKTRRREAYTQIRQHKKEFLARSALAQIRHAFALTVSHDTLALEHHNSCLATAFFSQWVARHQVLAVNELETRRRQNENLRRKVWSIIVSRQQKLHQLTERAEQQVSERVELPVVETCLERLSFAVFRMRAQQELGDQLRRRNEEKHYRQMLRRWNEAVQDRRYEHVPPESPTNSARFQTAARNVAGVASHVTNATGFDTSTSATATPAYLQTPSRRTTGRLRTRPPMPSATPGPSYVTPFINRLQAHYPSGLSRSSWRPNTESLGAQSDDEDNEMGPVAGNGSG